MPYDPDGTWREPYIETEEERRSRVQYEAEVIDDHLDAMSGLDPDDCRDMTALDQLGGAQHAAQVGLGTQTAQVYKSVSDALKALGDQPQPQQGTGMSEVARDQIEKLQEDVRVAEAKARQRGQGREL